MKLVLSILFRRKQAALVFAGCMIFFPMVLTYLISEKYTSSASILLTPGRFKKPFLPNEMDSRTGFVQVSMEDVASEAEIMMSPPVLKKVVLANQLHVFGEPGDDQQLARLLHGLIKGLNNFMVFLGLKYPMSDFDVAVSKLEDKMEVEFLKRTNIITVNWTGSTPELAQNVVESIVEEYIKHHIQVHGYEKALRVIEKEVKGNEKRIHDLELEILKIKKSLNVYDIEKERNIAIEKYLDAKATYENLVQIDSSSVVSTSRGIYSDSTIFVGLMNELTQVEMDRIKLISLYGEKDKRIKASEKQAENLNFMIQREHTQNVASWLVSRDRYKELLDSLTLAQAAVSALERELQGVLASYQISRQKYNEALISSVMDSAEISSAQIVSAASLPSSPSSPKRLLILIISTFFAVVGGIATAFSMEKLYSRIVSIDDLSKSTKLNVLFSIQEYSKDFVASLPLLLPDLNKKMAAIRVYLSSSVAQPKVHLVLGSKPGSGASFIAQRLAGYAYSVVQKPVLYLQIQYNNDSDCFALQNINDDNARAELKKNISVAASPDAGHSQLKIFVPPGIELGNHEGYGFLITELVTIGFTNIFVDISLERDDHRYLNFVPHSDHVFINVAYDITNKHALVRLLKILEEEGSASPSGVIFNRWQYPIPEFIYNRL